MAGSDHPKGSRIRCPPHPVAQRSLLLCSLKFVRFWSSAHINLCVTMNTDNRLLTEYTHQGSEAAFRELVERHINLVHSAALRESRGEGSVAEDITQAVFKWLGSRPNSHRTRPSLAGSTLACGG